MIKYGYTLKRSARRTVSVCIKEDNTLIVRAPLRMPLSEIERFVISKSGWIDRHLNRNAAESQALADVVSYKKILVAGDAVDFTVGERDGISPDGVQAKSLKSLKKLYVENFGEQFLQLFWEICRENDFTCGKVEFKDYKSRWGCCDRARNVAFNYKLLMLPQNLWRYVAVHELCHTVYMDHSKHFYALVGRIMPSCKTCIKQLKSYSRISRLY